MILLKMEVDVKIQVESSSIPSPEVEQLQQI
jgi:hypothetical protein